MVITKQYIKIFWAVFPTIAAVVIFLSENYGFGMIDHYCVQGNSVLGLYLQGLGISFCSLIVFVGEVLTVWAALLLLVAVFDVVTLPIRVAVRKRKEKVKVIKNPFYE